MGFLLRRTKRAFAGWYDNFNRPDESPLQFPWSSWGEPRTVSLTSNRLVLGYDSSGWFQPNPDGGVAYEHQPLTPDWAVEFFARVEKPNSDGQVNVFLDRNWTAGGSASSTEYQTYFRLNRATSSEDEDGNRDVEYAARIICRRKGTWLAALIFGITLTQSQYAANNRWRIIVFQDKYVGVLMNGKLVMLRVLENANYFLGDGKRAANFRNNHPGEVYIDDFRTYDQPDPRAQTWVEEFYDDFNRTNNSSVVGNGWSQIGAAFGIVSGAMSIPGGFSTDGRRGAWRGPFSKGDMRIEFTFGGGSGSPNGTSETTVFGRVNSAGTLGVGVVFHDTRMRLTCIGGPLNGTTYTDFSEDIKPIPNIANGQKFALCIVGDIVWLERMSDGAILMWSPGVNAYSPETNRGVAVALRRLPLTNSAPIDDLRVLTAA
ncbi:hypothetical protein CH267_01055 [Rhodococcus sp. 06-621-2]|nr:hypothetical protein CH267_01055 [Rhodococcus sp. 06-621-2]